MDIRIIVPINWFSDFRVNLFSTLKDLGYKWSKGDSLSADYPRLYKMTYIAINVIGNYCTFGSKTKIFDKPEGECGLNYIISGKRISDVIDTVNFMKQYLITDPTDEEKRKFVYDHLDFKKLYAIL